MSPSRENDLIDDLANGYEQMLERAVRDMYQKEKDTEKNLHHWLAQAGETAVGLKELTRSETELLASYVARDISHLKHYLSETGKDIKEWLGFEITLAEAELLDLLAKAADRGTVDLMLLNQTENIPATEYHAGEVAAPGTLKCRQCERQLELYRPTRLSACGDCSGEIFFRVAK